MLTHYGNMALHMVNVTRQTLPCKHCLWENASRLMLAFNPNHYCVNIKSHRLAAALNSTSFILALLQHLSEARLCVFQSGPAGVASYDRNHTALWVTLEDTNSLPCSVVCTCSCLSDEVQIRLVFTPGGQQRTVCRQRREERIVL